MIRVDHLARVKRMAAALQKAGKKHQAASLLHVLAEVDRHFQEPSRLPESKPTFLVRVISDYNGRGQRLQWAHSGTVATLKGQTTGRLGYLHYGTFACYPVHDGGPLIKDPPITAPPAEAPVKEWPFPTSAHEEPRC